MSIISPYTKVLEFHNTFGVEIGQSMTEKLQNLRSDLIEEESQATISALHGGTKVEVADGLADLVYVAYGAAITFGIDLDAVIDAVHESNMSKLDEHGKPIYRDDGKVLKGPNYRPPIITEAMLNYVPEYSVKT